MNAPPIIAVTAAGRGADGLELGIRVLGIAGCQARALNFWDGEDRTRHVVCGHRHD
jgi:hypothetical protein